MGAKNSLYTNILIVEADKHQNNICGFKTLQKNLET
jgi:hypothetical protein